MNLRTSSILAAILIGFAPLSRAATVSCTSQVSADKTNVCVGQPVEITIISTLCSNHTTYAANTNYTTSFPAAGIYTISNQCSTCGEASSWGFLDIYVSEVSTMTPPSVTMCPGSYEVFTAGGNPTNYPCDPSWAVFPTNAGTWWSFGNTATFTLCPTYTNGTATFYAYCDTTNSAAITVATGETLAITSQPASQVACIGQTVAMSVRATGNSLQYQWRWNRTVLSNSAGISGVNTPTLTISNVFADILMTGTVMAASQSGIDFGSVTGGGLYTYAATGCCWIGLCCSSNPDGMRSTDGCASFNSSGMVGGYSGFSCPGLTNWSLVGKIQDTCIQLGSSGEFVAPTSGVLTLLYNDSFYPDNSGSFTALVSRTVHGVYDCIVSSHCGSQISTSATLGVSSPCDGIPDWWRLEYFGSGTTTDNTSCASCDPAGDQISNSQKYEYGLDPNVSNAVDVLVNSGNVWATNQVITLDMGGLPFSFLKVSLNPAMANPMLYANTGISLLYTLPSTNNGTYDLFLQYTDAHTNALGPILFKPIALDTIPPVVQITSPTNGSGNEAFVHLQATVYDPVPTNGVVPDRRHPVHIWINGQQYRRRGNQIDIPRFPVQPYSNNVITIQAVDAAGNQSQATTNWYSNPSTNAPAPTFTVTGFAPNTVVDLPSDSQAWTCGQVSDLYAIITATVNGGAPITMNVRSNQFGYMLPLDWGTNTVLIVASDAGGNASSNTYRLARGNRYQFAITSPPQIYPNYVSGYVSAQRDAGLPTATNLVSVTVNGVPTTLTDGGGGLTNFTTTDSVPWPTDGSLLMLNVVTQWADGSQGPGSCPDDGWITVKQTSSLISDVSMGSTLEGLLPK